ncbi:MAG TPA: DUF255 domain-containing protein, partial [Luteolibacter sp.]|nr:DUF255 domain-containing protein [Luteolibacter sp.]
MPNALAGESSPYLLQHADNPVDWQPWSDEVFALAARREKLVFLSVGYSTCHWCHVMAHESFENEQVAAVLNHHFVCVKVDREERPYIDSLYMNYLQATTGQGGWPMSVWLTPDGSPVYGGTYFPPDDRAGRAGLTRVCHELARLWRDDRSHLEEQAQRAMTHLRHHAAAGRLSSGAVTADDAIDAFLQTCISIYDSQHGGFGSAPKFPRPALLLTLLQLCKRVDPEQPLATEAWRMSDHTLQAMADGGLHDQLGGGFHRYS